MIVLKPIKTEHTNLVYKAPEGMKNCGDLPVEKREDRIVSTWKVAEGTDVSKFIKDGILEVHILGFTVPPLSVVIP